MDAPGELIDIGGRRLHLLRRGAGSPNNGHSLALENPRLVAVAIAAVVGAARGRPFDVSRARELAAARSA